VSLNIFAPSGGSQFKVKKIMDINYNLNTWIYYVRKWRKNCTRCGPSCFASTNYLCYLFSNCGLVCLGEKKKKRLNSSYEIQILIKFESLVHQWCMKCKEYN
jgi:hypothetical protein